MNLLTERLAVVAGCYNVAEVADPGELVTDHIFTTVC